MTWVDSYVTNQVVYACMDPLRVPLETRELAERAARFFASELGIPTPEIRWFDEASLISHAREALNKASAFYTRGGTVYVRLGRHGDELVSSIAHEIRHAWQAAQDPLFWNYCAGARALDEYEADARAYASAAAERFRNDSRAKAHAWAYTVKCMAGGGVRW